jgi:uncharacterized membrane protein
VDWFVELTALLGWIVTAILFFYYLPVLPEAMATSFNLSGMPVGYSPKSSLMLLPLIAFLLYGGLTWLGWKPELLKYPVRLTYHNAEIQYRLMYRLISRLKLILQLFIFYLTYAIISMGMNQADGLHPNIIVVFLALIFFTAAYYLRQSVKNKG